MYGLHEPKVKFYTRFRKSFLKYIYNFYHIGRAPVDQRAVSIVEGQRGQKLTIRLTVSPLFGLIHSCMTAGGMTRQLFFDFVMEVSPSVNEPFVLLCDNTRPHKDAPQLQDGQEVKYLPRHSPFINSMEMAGSALKITMKHQLSNPVVQREIYDRAVPRESS